ncbi:hypothetical protein [Acinetobacter radioresistens]|uniref:hypothetical protein n=1 Tax=Acinetobacter radioresistens TaxID=40216 RepID=UPI0002DED5A9|nr:hypothetical protein [Acinetobacter radioresistens]
MSEYLGVTLFYVLSILGFTLGLVGLLELNVFIFSIGCALMISAFLIKSEFNLYVTFWKEN